jgi:hypothetical protein
VLCELGRTTAGRQEPCTWSGCRTRPIGLQYGRWQGVWCRDPFHSQLLRLACPSIRLPYRSARCRSAYTRQLRLGSLNLGPAAQCTSMDCTRRQRCPPPRQHRKRRRIQRLQNMRSYAPTTAHKRGMSCSSLCRLPWAQRCACQIWRAGLLLSGACCARGFATIRPRRQRIRHHPRLVRYISRGLRKCVERFRQHSSRLAGDGSRRS